jgi:alkanesulfonate monooxygenase SsuD/methylene tetrahydromethanopterin reductase-like flavin-dependent oxidoreductase (luciferase family)
MLPRRQPAASSGPRARIAVVQIAMTMPIMEPDLDTQVLRDWARAVDGGPFSSLCWGERMAFDNPETLTLMGALAAWTDQVRLMTTVIVPQLHDPVMLAKADVTYRGIRCPRVDARPMRGRHTLGLTPSFPLRHQGPP